jgi:uncharacterized protein (TIGR02058 family)
LAVDKSQLDVDVTIGVQRPDQVDVEKVRKALPIGNVVVTAVKGGLDVADRENNDPVTIASAAVAVRINVP